jgi:hypothetical protein
MIRDAQFSCVRTAQTINTHTTSPQAAEIDDVASHRGTVSA